MTTTRAAKYLAINDLGKTITVTDTDTGQTVTGELLHIDAIDCSPIDLTIIAGKDSGHYLVEHDDEITLAGQPSPPTDDPHGVSFRGEPELAAIRPTFHGLDQALRAEQLPAPIPAAQAADAIAHYTVHKDGHIEQNFQIRPRRNGKTTALNAAQAADNADLGISPGPVCCLGDCCGPGSYCCKHPHNYHEHDDEPDHEHIAVQSAAAHPSNHDYAWDIRNPNRDCYVCGRPEVEHQDEPEYDHEHVVSLQDAEHCILCGERLEYDENGNRL